MTDDNTRLPPDEEIMPAMIRAAHCAAQKAREYNRPLILWRNGKVVEVPVDELPQLVKQPADGK